MRRLAHKVMAIAAVLALAGCGNSFTDSIVAPRDAVASSADTTVAASASGSPTVASAAPSSPAPTSAQPPATSAPTRSCSTDGQSAIGAAASQIPPPLAANPRVPWVYDGATNFNTCNDLSYATLGTEGATASSPMQLLLFHQGSFVGTAVKCNLAYQTVTGATADSVDVNYRYLNPGDISANPTGTVDVSFTWTGSGVQMNGDLPAALTRGQC
ncbi:LppP/LprE family lipoprotein [Gordonia sp. CPCC 206044]|uniref:LppP/LprE family lipoprotein n=1 Tax=Gordonia sp. CPCC 206044 TaxID=3140793 RepID=UPI003AF3DF0A